MPHSRRSPKHFFDVQARLKEIIDDVNFRVSLVIVEGKHDEQALLRLGLKRPVRRLCDSMMPTFAFVDEVVEGYMGQTVLILLDFDEEGMRMAERVGNELEARGVKIDGFTRRNVSRLLLAEGIRRVEEVGTISSRAEF
ncbi:MAG TPA: hypothetical protein P5290_07670 [Candidatus Methanomethylicus sp.]|nr:hypothetical protein [Candidatus Methanomethylicus sp.]